MAIDPGTLRRLSSLLDHALALAPAQRDNWIDALAGDDAPLRATLRVMLAQHDAPETADLIDRGPLFTVPGAADTLELSAGDNIGPYRLVQLIGRGGMGEVWLAERSDGLVKRPVALKLPMLGMRRSALVQRFARERDILAALSHPHIARLYDAGVSADGQPYLALEYVEGRPVTDYCRDNRVSLRMRVEVLRQVAGAVQYAHANLVVHRDLKPSNVLVGNDGQAMLLDFGVAKLLQDEGAQAAETELTQLAGRALTPDYAAPEQLSSGTVSTATDVYALGVLAYELFAGRRPFKGVSRTELEFAVLTLDPERPSHVKDGVLASVPRGAASDLDAIVLKALKKSPAERYPTVNAFSEDLDRWLAGEPVQAQHDTVWYRVRKFASRHRLGVAASAAFAATLVAATVFSAWQASIARREARTAEAVESFMREVFAANTGQQVDPVAARNRTARELLDRGANRVDAALADAPQARARVLEILADMYGELALFRQTLELRRKQVELLRQLEPATSERLATAIGEQGQAATAANEMLEAQRAFDEARAILERRGDHASVTRGVLESSIAYLHMMKGTDGLEHATRAVAILRAHPPSPSLVRALERHAHLASDKGDIDGSIATLREALAIASTKLGEPGLELVGPLNHSIGTLYYVQDRWSEAEASEREAWEHASRRHGPDSLRTIGIATAVGRIAFENGLYRRALEIFEPTGASAERLAASGDRTWIPALAIALRGGARAMTGSLDEGVADLQRVVGMRETMEANERVASLVWPLLVDALIQQGQYRRAREALEAWRPGVDRQAGGNPYAVRRHHLAQLRLAQALGDRNSIVRLIAMANLDVPSDDQGRPVAASSERADSTAVRLVVLGEARLAAGEADPAAADALRALAIVAQSKQPDYHRDRERRASLVAGKALIELRRAREAIPPLRRSVAIGEQPLDVAQTLAHADAIVALATALADEGSRDEARALMRHAQAVHARNPTVAPHFRKPLARLEARLDDARATTARR